MKYIRIKNGACAVNDESYNVKYIIPAEEYLKKYYFDANYIIAQADTIDELCDCFVVVGKKHYIWDKQHCLGLTFEQVKQSYSAYDFEIYGAIWTEKGLIYVAKMNDKGDLELV